MDIKQIVQENLNMMVENERENSRYMFFANLEQICRQMELLKQLDRAMVETILDDGHDWAADHLATAKESIDQVFDFLMNKVN